MGEIIWFLSGLAVGWLICCLRIRRTLKKRPKIKTP